jgi:hypothetical protein
LVKLHLTWPKRSLVHELFSMSTLVELNSVPGEIRQLF